MMKLMLEQLYSRWHYRRCLSYDNDAISVEQNPDPAWLVEDYVAAWKTLEDV